MKGSLYAAADVASLSSERAKTAVTIGLMAALKRKGHIVQGFKCGPDCIDPTYHTAVTGRASRNLDSYMLPHDTVKEIFVWGSAGADISIIEGVMGMYDGKKAILIDSPVLLVVNCQSMTRSVAAIIKGFQLLNPGARIAGIIANKAGSEGHYKLIKAAIEQECGIPVVGYLMRENELGIPERHLGLVPSVERGELAPLFVRLAHLIGETVDLDLVWELAKAEPKLFAPTAAPERVTIVVAKDPAFHFYYPENLELREGYGAKLRFFSPLANETVPAEAGGLYIGGGHPERVADAGGVRRVHVFDGSDRHDGRRQLPDGRTDPGQGDEAEEAGGLGLSLGLRKSRQLPARHRGCGQRARVSLFDVLGGCRAAPRV